MLRTHDNRILISDNGKLIEPYTLPDIIVTNRGSVFPDGYSGSTSVNITTSIANTIFIDFGDGSEVYEIEFTGLLQIRRSTPIHTYSVSGDYQVRIWFKFPSKITSVEFNWVYFYGNFPVALSLYNLNNLRLNNCYFNDFPVNFGASSIRTLEVENPIAGTITNIPLWITRSRIDRLNYGGSRIDLSNSVTNNVDKLINIQGFTSLNFLIGCRLADIPSNIQHIETLRYLHFGGDTPVPSITPNINACKQISHLSFGYTSHSNFGSLSTNAWVFTSWGLGVSNMPNLQALYLGNCISAPTTAIVGLETAPLLKTLYMRSSYNTVERVDTFITNMFSTVETFASKITGNTLLRQVRFEIAQIASNAPTVRPTGVYQAPSGYVQGSSNGTPASPMEMIYVLVKQYRWTVLVNNTSNNGVETLTP